MKRVCIVLDKSLEKGVACNVAAILMGQLTCTVNDLYSVTTLTDTSMTHHASIQYSTIILKANSSIQLLNWLDNNRSNDDVCIYAFSRFGQKLNNEPREYEAGVISKTTKELDVVGIIIYGTDPVVRQLTKKFSVG